MIREYEIPSRSPYYYSRYIWITTYSSFMLQGWIQDFWIGGSYV